MLLSYGLLNAALYACLLPLWEGFDEEFHYGYVEYLREHHSFPVLGRAQLSAEINRSLALLPISHVMIENLHLQGVRTYDQYFALDSPTRHRLHDEAWRIPAALGSREEPMYYWNYEVHHGPLAYIAMAIPDWLLERAPLPARVLVVRLLAGAAAAVLTFYALLALAAEIRLNRAMELLLVFLVFSCQMFWATVAHVANDWLAVPLASWVVVYALRFDRNPSVAAAVRLAAALSLGLLAKAYVLVFVPPYIAAAYVWRRRRMLSNHALIALTAIPVLLGGPWYLRNVLLYGNPSGRIEESSGVSVAGALRSLASIPWLHSLPFMARGALWMGNASFTDYSVRTMNDLLMLLAAAIVLYGWSALRNSDRAALAREFAALWSPVVLFTAAMIYVTGSSYTYTHGAADAASPWYLQAVMPLFLCIALLGCQRSPRVGRWVAVLSCVLWGYVMAGTYVAKLFPLYGGFRGGRSTARDLYRWYTTSWPYAADILNTTALAPSAVLVVLLFCLLAVLVTLLPYLAAPIFRITRRATSAPPDPMSAGV